MWYPTKERVDQLDSRLADLQHASGYIDGNPEAFTVRISTCINRLAATKAVPTSYLRDWIWISSHYRMKLGSGNRALALATRALLFLQQSLSAEIDQKPGFRNDINWVTDYTVSGLGAKVGPNDFISFFSPDDHRNVENRIRELRADASSLSSEEDVAIGTYLVRFSDMRAEKYLPEIMEIIFRLQKTTQTDETDAGRSLSWALGR